MIPKNALKKLDWLTSLPFLLASACATRGEVRIESNPDAADVSVVDTSKTPRKIGVTPFTLNHENVPGIFKEPVQVNVSKDGYKSTSLLLPETLVTSSGAVMLQLKKDDTQLLNGTAQSVAEAQRLVFNKRYPDAERMLEDATNKYPSVAVLHSLLGNVFYLQKNIPRALDSYQKAQAMDPNNPELGKMILKLKGLRSASGGGN